MAHGASNSDDPGDGTEESSDGIRTATPCDPPKTLFAEIFVASDDLVLVPTIKSVSDVTIQLETVPTADSPLAFVSVVGNDFTKFERKLETDQTVHEATLFSTAADQRVYRVQTESAATSVFSTTAELGLRTLDVKSQNEGWVVRIQLLAREPLIELRKRCLGTDVQFKVQQLYDSDPNAEIEGGRLTGHQRNTILTAYQLGYYNIPRGISQGELAVELDVSTSAISQQLRRATGQLIASTFAIEKED